MSSKLTETAPQRIWLCVSDDQDDYELSYSDLRDNEADITWSSDQPVDCTIEYVRADIAESELAAAQRERDQFHDTMLRQGADLAAARADAERYRWLRDHATPPTLASIAWGSSIEACNYSDPDEAIDAAIARERKP